MTPSPLGCWRFGRRCRRLREQLVARVGEGCGANHARHSQAATRALTRHVERDLKTLGQDKETFRFFLAFAQEVIDRYGRLPAYLNREQPDRDQPEPGPPSYNERLLADGLVSPYFIWPNVDPFRAAPGLLEAVPKPGTQQRLVERSPACSPPRTRCAWWPSSCAFSRAASRPTGG